MSYKPGQWWAICDVCGFKKLNTELRKRWDGFMVCKQDWEPRHPQDILHPRVGEVLTVPWTRPEPADVFIQVPYIFDEGSYWGANYTTDNADAFDFYISPFA